MAPKSLKRKATGSEEDTMRKSALSHEDTDDKSVPAAEASPPPSVINSFRGEYNFLSNFFHSPITCDGLEFPTVEHAFQAAKCLDHENKLRILECKSPTIAKRVGLTVPLRPDWERVKLGIMQDILTLKFAPGSHFGNLLLATGVAELIEGNTWHDNFWGSCVCARHNSTPGQNKLGKLIMIVRQNLQSNQKPFSSENLPCPS